MTLFELAGGVSEEFMLGACAFSHEHDKSAGFLKFEFL